MDQQTQSMSSEQLLMLYAQWNLQNKLQLEEARKQQKYHEQDNNRNQAN